MTSDDFSADIAVIVGIAAYDPALGTLQTPVRDATAVARLLASRFDYQVILQCDGAATLPGLRTLLHQELPKRVPESSRLLFYFAGHGIAQPNAEIEGPQGYLVPYGATSQVETHLPMSELQEALKKLPCRHLLVILDCCFSGAFRWASQRPMLIPEEILYEECYKKWLRHPAHWALASAAHDEHSFDTPDRRRGRRDDLSPFASALRDGLSGEADYGKNGGDGVITLAELNAYLLNRLAPRQTPLMMPLPGQSKGAFVFRDLRRLRPLMSAEQMVILNEDENPYQGLEPYGAGQAELFFGRTKAARQLLRHVRIHPLTVVTGPSGSGKSSLVQAGLQARLQTRRVDRHPRRGRMAGWIVPPPLRVTIDPFTALAETLAQAGGPQPPSPDELRSNPVAARSWISTWAASRPCERLLLVVDQAEELITRVSPERTTKPGELPEASAGFLACLGNLLEAGAGRVRVLIAVRSDYEPDLEEGPLALLWNTGRFVVPLLSRDELREVIEGPAGHKALYFEDPALVDRLIDEVIGMPGGLPLLSYALSRLYLAYLKNKRRDRLLTAEDLASIGSEGSGAPGGIVRILREEADRAVRELPDPEHREVLWRILLRMVNLTGARPIRRQVSLSELDYFRSGENQRRDEILRRFIKEERLLVSGRDGIEPAHDELLVSWPELTRRIDAARERIPIHRRLTETSAEWVTRTSPPRRGLDLRLLGLVEGTIVPVEWLNRAEMRYLTAAREERRSRTRLQWRLVALAFLLTVGAAIFFLVQNQRNIKLRYQSTIQSLINQAEADLAAGQTARGLLLASQAFGFLPRSEGDLAGRVDQLFRKFLDDLPPSRVVLRDQEDPYPVAFHPTGRLLVASHRGALVQMTLSEEGIEPAGPTQPLPGAPGTRIQAVAFSADGRWLAAGFGGGSLCVWHLAGSPPVPLPGVFACVEAGPDPFSQLAFQPGTTLLEVEREESGRAATPQVWELAGGPGAPRLRRRLDRPVNTLRGPAGSKDGTPPIADSRLLALCRSDATAVAVAPGGLKAAVACDGALRLWDLKPGRGGWSRGVGRQRLQVPSVATVLAARPRRPGVIAMGKASGDVELLDTSTGGTSSLSRPLTLGLLGPDPGGLIPHCQGSGVASLVWSPDGEILHILGRDGLWRWQTPKGEPRTRWLGGCVCSAVGSADGSWLAVLLEIIPGQTQLEVLPFSGEGEPVPLGEIRSNAADRCRVGLAFHPRRSELLVGIGTQVSLWIRSAAGAWQPRPLTETDGPIMAAAWAKGPQGEDLPVVGGRGFALEGFVEVLDSLGTRRRQWTFSEAPVSGLAFDPNERQLAAATSGGGLNLLDLDAPAAVPTVLGPTTKSFPESPIFLDSSQLAVLLDEEVSLWRIGTKALAKAACDTAASNLFFNDWTSYVDPAPDHYEMACPDPAIGPHPSVLAYADSLAWTGNVNAAQRIYRRLNELKPGIVVNPSRRARGQRLASELSRFNVTDRERILEEMSRAEEYDALRRAEGLLPPPQRTLLRLCRWGTVLGEPQRALRFCDATLEALPGDGMARDSRGLARAVLGHLEAAREDFLASRDWLNDPAWRKQRQAWIDVLGAGRNPITPEVLGQIAREELGIEPSRKARLAAR